jgi:hypothetical protein
MGRGFAAPGHFVPSVVEKSNFKQFPDRRRIYETFSFCFGVNPAPSPVIPLLPVPRSWQKPQLSATGAN